MVNDSNIITINSIESKMKINKFSGNHKQETIEGIQILENTNKGTTGWSWSTSPSNMGIIEEVSYLGTRGCKFSLPENSYAWKFLWRNVNRDKLKNNTTYTIQFDAKTNYNENIIIAIQNMTAQNKLVNFGTININGENRIKVVANSNTIEILDQVLYIYVDNIANASGRELIITNLILVEGDYTDTDLEWEEYTDLQGSPSLDFSSYVYSLGDNINILPNEAESKSANGINWTVNEDGSVKAIGTATNNEGLYLIGNTSATEEVFRFKANKQYKNVGNVDILYRKIDGNYVKLQKNTVFSFSEDEIIGLIYLQIASGETVDETYYPKIVEYYEEIDESYSPYEQGAVGIKKINTNLLNNKQVFKDIGRSINGLTISQNEDGSIILDGISTKETQFWFYFSGVRVVKGYKFDKYVRAGSISDEKGLSLELYNKDIKQICLNNFNNNVVKENDIITTGYVKINQGVTFDNYIINYAISKVSLDNFVENEESSYTLPIQQPMFLGDYFDLKRGKEVHHFNKFIATSEKGSWQETSDIAHRYVLFRSDANHSLNNTNQFCSHSNFCFDWGIQEGSFQVRTSGSYYLNSNNIANAEEFNQFIAEQEEAGTPLTFWFEVEEYELDLTEEQITVLNELKNVILYDDITNILLPDVYPILDYDVEKIIDDTVEFDAILDNRGYFIVPNYDIKCLVSYSESDIPSMPEAVETSVSVPGRDGDIPLNTIYNPISFTIVCYTEDNLTPEEKYAEETKMNKFLNSIKNNTIKLKLESKGKYYDVKYNGQLTTINYPKHLQFSIPLKSSSSYAKDIDEYYILGNGEEESDTIKEVGAVFVIEGPAQTPKISLNDYEMFYDNVLLSNTKLVIDSNKSTVTMINREGTATNAMRYYNHEFPKIQNGNNVLKVLSGIDEDRQVNVRWFDLKL